MDRNTNHCLLLNQSDMKKACRGRTSEIASALESAFRALGEGSVILPEKSSQVFDRMVQNRINCMPSTLLDQKRAGVKWVSVFPNNPSKYDLPNVGGLMLLSEIEAGQTLSVMDAGYLTSLRTALVDALAAKYLMRPGATSLGVIGTGEQAKSHAEIFFELFPHLNRCYVSGRNSAKASALSAHLSANGINCTNCGSDYEAAVKDADIIITATSAQLPLLKEKWIRSGSLYCHVGGWEDEYSVAKRATKIVCDDWEALKHRGSPTLAKMFAEGELSDSDIYCGLADIIRGIKAPRERHDDLIYFNAIGLSITDVAIASWIWERCIELDLGLTFDFAR